MIQLARARPDQATSLNGLLELRNLRKLYGDVIAVDNVVLDVRPNEFLTLLGPSGSGKTTTLLMIAGFVQPTEGQIVLSNTSLTALPPYRRNIGMVFQHYALFPHMTVAQNVAFPLEMRKVKRPDIARRVQSALELVRLPDYGRRYPRELSGGQQQRVALARAIVFEPRLLLMDEPLGALDKKLREQMQLEIKRIHRELGMTVIYVTHDQQEALVMSDRIAVFHEGRIEQVGTPEELYEQPSSVFVADFLGESNFFKASVVGFDDTYCVLESGGVQLCARTRPGFEIHDNVVLAVRPEKTQVVESHRTQPHHGNRIDGCVKDVVYLGDCRKYIIARENADDVIVRQQVSAACEATIAIGQHVGVWWNADDGVVLSAE